MLKEKLGTNAAWLFALGAAVIAVLFTLVLDPTRPGSWKVIFGAIAIASSVLAAASTRLTTARLGGVVGRFALAGLLVGVVYFGYAHYLMGKATDAAAAAGLTVTGDAGGLASLFGTFGGVFVFLLVVIAALSGAVIGSRLGGRFALVRGTSIGALAAIVLHHAPAFAEDAWGTVEDGDKACTNELTQGTPEWVNGTWVSFEKGMPVEPKNTSAGCKAELAKRVDACQKGPEFEKLKANGGWASEAGADAPRLICAMEAWERLKRARKRAVEEKKQAEDRKARAEKAELPKAAKKDKWIEKQIIATYKKEFPAAKVLKVIIIDKGWTTERNDFGTIIGRNIQAAVVNQQKDVCEVYNELWQQEYIRGRFTGPLLERGAGSLQRYEIACSKVK